MTLTRWIPLAILAALATAACGGPSLRHVGYVGTNKVYYHWAHSQSEHSIIVCDVQPDGSESNCEETDL